MTRLRPPPTTAYSATAAALALCAAFAAVPVTAADMTFTPAASSGVVIESAPGAPALRVQPTGAVQVPGLPGTPATLTTAVCHDASGALGRCDPAALAGAQGPAGPTGPAGPAGAIGAAGPSGPAGPKGLTPRMAFQAEPAGANCATGGVRVSQGMDANDNGVLDAGEVTTTTYVCNGALGPQGPKGDTGPSGSGGVTGMTEVRHGCFQANTTPISGAGYAVGLSGGVYTVTFNPALGAGNYTLLLDGRTSTGRSLAVAQGGSVGTGLTFTPGWLDAGGETIDRICFMLAR